MGKAPFLSRLWYIAYSMATTLGEYFALRTGTPAEARQDLRFDATRGHVVAPGLELPVVHAVAAPLRWGRVQRSWRDTPDPSGQAWEAEYEARLTDHSRDMELL